MLPTSDQYASKGTINHNIPARPFVAYIDDQYNTIRPDESETPGHARFDEWLVHHLLGEPYEGTPDPEDPNWKPRTIWDDIHPRFLEACNMAGISTIGDAMAIDATAMHWFLLWSANAGNYEGSGQTFGAWLQATHGSTISEAAWSGTLYAKNGNRTGLEGDHQEK
nr:hypothetical protein [Candidatus Sigynarchaeum springense]